MKPGARALVAVLVFLLLAGGAWATRARHAGWARPGPPLPDSTLAAPPGVRIRVQVINTTRARGLARRATHLLRDQGFDVVEMSTAGPPQDSTVVLDRSGHPDWAGRIAKLLGPTARAEQRRDSSHYLDVTVLLGSGWRPPPEPLDP